MSRHRTSRPLPPAEARSAGSAVTRNSRHCHERIAELFGSGRRFDRRAVRCDPAGRNRVHPASGSLPASDPLPLGWTGAGTLPRLDGKLGPSRRSRTAHRQLVPPTPSSRVRTVDARCRTGRAQDQVRARPVVVTGLIPGYWTPLAWRPPVVIGSADGSGGRGLGQLLLNVGADRFQRTRLCASNPPSSIRPIAAAHEDIRQRERPVDLTEDRGSGRSGAVCDGW